MYNHYSHNKLNKYSCYVLYNNISSMYNHIHLIFIINLLYSQLYSWSTKMINTYTHPFQSVRGWSPSLALTASPRPQSGSDGQPLGPSRAVFTQGQQQGEYGHWGKGLRGRSRSHSLNGITFTGGVWSQHVHNSVLLCLCVARYSFLSHFFFSSIYRPWLVSLTFKCVFI